MNYTYISIKRTKFVVQFLILTKEFSNYMKKWIFLAFSICLFTLSSCIEIIDDISLNNDGTGTFRYTINLSSSKVKVNSILALDSLDGKPIPSKDEIKAKLTEFQAKLSSQEGIKNVQLEEDLTNYIFKLSCEFQNIELLQSGIKKTLAEIIQHQKNDMDTYQWITWNGNALSRSIPQMAVEQAKILKTEDMELLKQGTYTNITRFENEVEKFENETAVLAKNKKAVMLRVSTYSLIKNVDLMKNKITIVN